MARTEPVCPAKGSFIHGQAGPELLANLRRGPGMTLVPAPALLALVGIYLVTTARLDAHDARVKQAGQAEPIIAPVGEIRVAGKDCLCRDGGVVGRGEGDLAHYLRSSAGTVRLG